MLWNQELSGAPVERYDPVQGKEEGGYILAIMIYLFHFTFYYCVDFLADLDFDVTL